MNARLVVEVAGWLAVTYALQGCAGSRQSSSAIRPAVSDQALAQVAQEYYDRVKVRTTQPTSGPYHTEVDASDFLLRAQTEKDSRIRLWQLLEIIGPRTDFAWSKRSIFPFVGQVRGQLRTIILSGLFDKPDDGAGIDSLPGKTPAGRAKWLLRVWGDKADEDLGPAPKTLAPNFDGIAADTMAEALRCATEAHFANEKVQQSPPSNYVWVAFGADGQRAMILMRVTYAYWGYDELIVLVRRDQKWRVHMIETARHFELERAD